MTGAKTAAAAAACVCVDAVRPVVVGGSVVAVDAPDAAAVTVTEAVLAAVSPELSAAPDADVPPPDADAADAPAPDADGCGAAAAGAARSAGPSATRRRETLESAVVVRLSAGRGSYHQTCRGLMSSALSPDRSRFLLWTVKSTRNMCYCQTL